ncbi:emopamil-binding family protein [Streptomyces mirabilis]|nr:emopamil-binding family protein [Streptomyces mirabilis]
MRRTTEDRGTLAFLAFSLLLAFSVELYFILHFRDINHQSNAVASLFQVYGAGDRAYYGQGDVYFPFALETLNVFVTQVFNVLLAAAVLRDKPYRYPLQLGVCSYVAYSVVLYFWRAAVDGFANMPEHDAWGFFIFFAPNLPWLAGNALLVVSAGRAVTARFRENGGSAQERTPGATAVTAQGRRPIGDRAAAAECPPSDR